MSNNTNQNKVIGRVSALEKQPSTIDEFFFWTESDVILNPFDVVVVDHLSDSKTYGVIEEISHITDSASFLGVFISNDFGDLENCPALTSRIGMNYVKARVVGNTKNIYIPVHNGSDVCLGSMEDISEALGLNQKKNSLVCGFVEMYSGVEDNRVELPVFINSDFLIGPEGAHLNISGISGLAAKTSYSMFLLNALQQKSMQNEGSKSVAYILLNVKGRDLLTIDEIADDLTDNDKRMYQTMGLELQPFRNVTYFYPYAQNDGIVSYVRPETFQKQLLRKKAYKYKYSFQEDKESIELLFSNIDDPQQTIESIINYIISEQQPFTNIDDWEGLLDNVREMGQAGCKKGEKEISVMSWRKFSRILRKSLESNCMFSNEVRSFKQETRLEESIKHIQKNDVFVVDVAKQDENMQAFVFGTVMQAVQKLKLGEFDGDLTEEQKEQIPDRIVIFVDELNKYASNDTPKSSPILRLLLDIAERGRSLGIVLFSAEQFKSAIHKRITGNCATHAYGRTNSIELADKAYSFVPATYKNMMTRLKQGQYIIQNPVFSSLLKIQFPRPLYKQDKGDSN